MKEITLNNKEYLLVEIPDDDSHYSIDNGIYTSLYNDSKGESGVILSNKSLNLKIISKISDILKDEDICEGLVEHHPNLDYRDYKPDGFKILENWTANWKFTRATDSFLSYLQSIDLDMTKEYLLIQKL